MLTVLEYLANTKHDNKKQMNCLFMQLRCCHIDTFSNVTFQTTMYNQQMFLSDNL